MPQKRFALGQRLIVKQTQREVCVAVIVPPYCNPFREIRRTLGTVINVRIDKSGPSDHVAMRDHESYVVSGTYENNGIAYWWPKVGSLSEVIHAAD